MAFRVCGALILTAAMAAGAACGGSSPESQQSAAPAAPAAAPAADHTQHAGGKVFFVQPANGATVKSPVQFVFGNEQLTISPVPPGELKEARPNMVHYHLGVDTDCLPAGQMIPKAQPWIHFGDGKNVIEMQMTPGQHKFAVQTGDDLHLAGLCETITVNVTE